MVALLVDIGQFIIRFHPRFHEWLVAPICEVEGHIMKVDDLFVSFDCDFKAIRFEHLADFLLGFFSISFGVALQIARPSLRYRPTSFLNFGAIKDNM